MKKSIVIGAISIIFSTATIADQQKFQFDFLNSDGTEVLGMGHGHFDPDVTETITIQPGTGDNDQFDTHLKLTQIGITVVGKSETGKEVSVGYVHNDTEHNLNDLYPSTWLNTDEEPPGGAGYSDGIGTINGNRINGKWRFGTSEDRMLMLNFKDRTWIQDTKLTAAQANEGEGKDPVRVRSQGLFRLKMVALNAELPDWDTVLADEPATDSGTGGGDSDGSSVSSGSDSVPEAPQFTEGTIDIFDNTEVNKIVEEAKAAEEAKNKHGSGALGLACLTFGALPMLIRRKRR